jgi:hypothetical protein
MNTSSIRKAAILLAAIAAVGVSTGQAALTVTPIGESAIAGELRGLSKADWATAKVTNQVTVGSLTFQHNDSSDDMTPLFTFNHPGDRMTAEELFTCAGFTNELRLEIGGQLLMSSKADSKSEGVMVRSDNPPEDLTSLVFLTDTTNTNMTASAGNVHLNHASNLRTYSVKTGNTTHFIWALEDIDPRATGNDWDYNDYLVYATISAVPEPSTIISGMAVAFLGLTILRRRLTARKTAA